MHCTRRTLGARTGNKEGQRRVNGLARGTTEGMNNMPSATSVPDTTQSATKPDLRHYRKWANALLWSCVHDRIELRDIYTGAPARWDCKASVYECGNGHIYERLDDCSWAVLTLSADRVA